MSNIAYFSETVDISVLLQSFGDGGEEDDDDLSDNEKIDKMFNLPDYLTIIKESSKKKLQQKIFKKKSKFLIMIFLEMQNQNPKFKVL